MRIKNTKTRLFIPASLKMNVEIHLSLNHAHFLGKVLRLKVGDRITVFNENDGECLKKLLGPGGTRKGQH